MMKRILKFVNAALFLAAFGVCYVEFVRLAVIKASLMDLIKLGFGKSGGPAFAEEIFEIIQNSIMPFAILALTLIALMWGGVVLSIVLRRNLPYICDIFLALIQAAGVSGIYFGIGAGMETLKSGLSFFGMGSQVKMYSSTLSIWLFIYGMIILVSSIGLALKDEQRTQEHGPIMPEQFYSGKNPLGREGFVRSTEQDYLDRIQRLERVQMRHNQDISKAASQAIPTGRRFTGAVAGLTGEYASKAFPLSERQQVFFVQKEGTVRLLESEGQTTAASVYYIEEYQEYCVIPYEMKIVFLKSGQPLGKGRTYYLPRGTEIYIKTKQYRFRLA